MKELLASVLVLNYIWVIEIAGLIAVFYLLNHLLKRKLIHIAHQDKKTGGKSLDFIHEILFPARVLFVLLLVSFCLQIVSQRFLALNTLPFVVPMRNIGIVFCVLWSLFRGKRYFFRSISKRIGKTSIPIDSFSLEISGKIFNIIVIFVGFVVILQIFGLDIVPFVTFGGIGVAAIGFASKDIISNYISGFMLYATRPFSVGDLIELPDRNICGHIEEIGWCLTSIRDLHKRPIFIPNTIFTSVLLMNITRMSHRCIHEIIGVRFTDIGKISVILDKIRALLRSHKKIDNSQPIYVFFKSFGSYSLEIEIRAYVTETSYEGFMSVKEKVLLEINDIITSQVAEIAYPTSVMKI